MDAAVPRRSGGTVTSTTASWPFVSAAPGLDDGEAGNPLAGVLGERRIGCPMASWASLSGRAIA
jgi:hypothetical protein